MQSAGRDYWLHRGEELRASANGEKYGRRKVQCWLPKNALRRRREKKRRIRGRKKERMHRHWKSDGVFERRARMKFMSAKINAPFDIFRGKEDKCGLDRSWVTMPAIKQSPARRQSTRSIARTQMFFIRKSEGEEIRAGFSTHIRLPTWNDCTGSKFQEIFPEIFWSRRRAITHPAADHVWVNECVCVCEKETSFLFLERRIKCTKN